MKYFANAREVLVSCQRYYVGHSVEPSDNEDILTNTTYHNYTLYSLSLGCFDLYAQSLSKFIDLRQKNKKTNKKQSQYP